MTGSNVAVSVVVAEDESIIRLDLVESLRSEGYDVVADTGSGAEAIELVARHTPDVVVLDIKMPGIDGIEVTRAVTVERQTAVVILTAFSQRELIDAARDAGAMAFLVKPYQRDELVPAIELALARFREFSALEDHAADLEDRLEVRKVLDRAKGLLIDSHGLSEADAYSFIQQRAMSQRRTMRDVAEDVLDRRIAP
jgi:response regulator NasT